ncbi:hypothetical protein [Staphylococcus borealis]|uniref:hypothetical protein n=1 Tax=Staphylococcus borealis TaxID=2742203 RepID=UPI002DB9348F|nr:hypothetical protein [Staphylococcus borealis]MEB7460952.1 hypothetical protein [Staphylococcus borealis]
MKITIIHQRHNAKTPTKIQHELRESGVKGFVVKVAGSRVTMLVDRENINTNRECVRNAKD